MLKKPILAEFKMEDDGLEVVHVPTGARFSTHPYGQRSERRIVSMSLRDLGSILTNGDEFETDEVLAMAEKLLRGEKID